MPATLYPAYHAHVAGGLINFASDTIKAMICSSSYSPSLADDFKNDVTNEVAGTGYTAGGATLASKAATLTAANSWGTSRANSTAYVAGDIYRPASANGYVYQCISPGTSAGSPPTFTTVVGDDFADGTATFTCRGRYVFTLDAADPSWPSSTITGRTVVIYKDTGTPSTSPLICYDTAGADVSSTAGTWTYQVAANGFVVLFSD